jgi:hypothetical protein
LVRIFDRAILDARRATGADIFENIARFFHYRNGIVPDLAFDAIDFGIS